MEYGIFGLLVLIANIYAIFKTWTSSATTLAKLIWTVVILVLPVLGFIAWLIAGPKGGNTIRV